MTAMQIELLGGPGDGQIFGVPDDTRIWVVTQPPMTAEEFIAMENKPSLMQFAAFRSRQFAYTYESRHSPTTGARFFRYMGERVVTE
jgi:hypothetical protein